MAFDKRKSSCCINILNLLTTGKIDAKEADELLASIEHAEEIR